MSTINPRIKPNIPEKNKLVLKVHEVLKIRKYWLDNLNSLPDYTTISQCIELYAKEEMGMNFPDMEKINLAHGRMLNKNDILLMLTTSRSFQVRPEVYNFYKDYIKSAKWVRF